MKIVVTVSDLAWGGKHRYMTDVAEGLGARGHDVVVVAEAEGRMENYIEATRLGLLRVPSFEFGDCSDVLRGEIEGKSSPDIVITTGRRDTRAVCQLLKGRVDRPGLVVYRHSAFAMEEVQVAEIAEIGPDLVVATSLEQADRQFGRFVADGRLDSERLIVQPSSISSAFVTSVDGADRDAERARLGIDLESFVFLVAARLTWEKGVDRAIRAFASLGEDLREFGTLLVAGEGEDRPALESLARDLEVENQVRFVGHVEEMSALYRAADAVVLTSTVAETGPLVLKEAMAAGLPVVASRIGGIPEFVSDEVHGFLVDSDEDISRALGSLLKDEALAGQMGSKARAETLIKERLSQRIDHLEARLARIHLSRESGTTALREFVWGDIRLRRDARPLVFVPRTSLMFELVAAEFDAVAASVAAMDPTSLADDRVSAATLDNLCIAGALVLSPAGVSADSLS